MRLWVHEQIDIDEATSHSLYQRLVWSLVWLGILNEGISAWQSWSTWGGAAVCAPLLVLIGIVGMAFIWLEEAAPSSFLQHLTVGLVAVAAFIGQVANIATSKFYSTDAAAFNQQATALLLRGKNPYTHNLDAAAQYLKGIANYWTYTVNGGYVNHMSYPAGGLLLQAPLQMIDHWRPTDWTDLIAWFATTLIMYVAMPKSLRWISPLLMLMGPYLFPAANGGTDAMFMPFLLLAVWRWDRFSDHGASRWVRYCGPVALGVACSIKQSPWFCVPFLVFGIYLEARSHRERAVSVALQYLAVVAGVFLLINAPFIMWSPTAWLRGILLPLTNPLIPEGQGLVTLAVHGIVRGVHMRILAIAGALGWATVGLGYVLWYKNLKRAWLFLLPIVLFVPARSLSSYLVDFFPAAILAAATTTAPTTTFLPRLRTPKRVALILAPVVALLLTAGYSFSSPTLNVKVVTFSTLDSNLYLHSVTAQITNNSGKAVDAHVLVEIGSDHPTGFWFDSRDNNSLHLGPHEIRTFRLHQPAWTFAPRLGQNWMLEVFTANPQTLNTSVPIVWKLSNSY